MNTAQKFPIYREIEKIITHLLKASQPIHPDQALITDSISICKDLKIGITLLQDLEVIVNLIMKFSVWLSQGLQRESRLAKSLLERLNGKTYGNILEIPRGRETKFRDVMKEIVAKNCDLGWVRYIDQLIHQEEKNQNATCHKIEIPLKDLERFLPKFVPSGKSWEGTLLFHIRAKNAEELNQGNYQVICESSFEQISLIFSRYAYLFSSQDNTKKNPIKEGIQDYYQTAKKSMQENIKWAGVLYSSWSRLDTAGWFPNYHNLEIESIGPPSGLPPEKIIPLRELFFTVDTNNQKVRLIWEKPNEPPQQIHPVYDGLLNTLSELHLHFLRRLQYTEYGLPFWLLHPNQFHQSLPHHYPRIVIGRIVLSRERWYLQRKEIEEVQEHDLWRCFQSINHWRKKHNMPRYVFVNAYLAEADFLPNKRFLVDYENPFSVDVFCSTLRKCKPEEIVTIIEMLPEPGYLWTQNAFGNYTHELAISIFGNMDK